MHMTSSVSMARISILIHQQILLLWIEYQVDAQADRLLQLLVEWQILPWVSLFFSLFVELLDSQCVHCAFLSAALLLLAFLAYFNFTRITSAMQQTYPDPDTVMFAIPSCSALYAPKNLQSYFNGPLTSRLHRPMACSNIFIFLESPQTSFKLCFGFRSILSLVHQLVHLKSLNFTRTALE